MGSRVFALLSLSRWCCRQARRGLDADGGHPHERCRVAAYYELRRPHLRRSRRAALITAGMSRAFCAPCFATKK